METGVGAAIASGNQYIKGNWALFVMAATKIRRAKIAGLFIVEGHKAQALHCPCESNRAIATNKKQSPIRLVRAVTNPLLRALLVG